MKSIIYSFLVAVALLLQVSVFAQQNFQYSDNWGKAGFNVEKQSSTGMTLSFSVPNFSISDITVNGEKMKSIDLSGVYLPNNAGAPNIPGTGRYICIPQGATASMEIVGYRTELIQNVEVAPAPIIPKETQDGLEYPVNEQIYNTNAYYPSQSVILSEPTKIRGVDVVMLGISPFQYNPVTKELLVYKDIRVNIHFQGGNGHFGEDRLRSRWFDPLLQDMLLNPGMLGDVNYNKTTVNSDDVGFEYLIIVPNDSYFSSWADSIKLFRQRQGIITGIKTLAQVGGNTTTAIESYLDNAFNTWTIPPVACLLIGDYGTNAANTMTSPIWDSYCVSDNIYGDVDGNSMPDIVMARMTAQNEAQLQVMVRKFLDYERHPPISEDFYNHPITALGWQTERWFQVCSEVIGGFWHNALGKEPVRINAVYSGNPTVDPWSTATNTADVITYFGPAGLGYIPATPQGIGGFSGGTPAQVTTALNDGSFMLQHRDHGFEDGWGEPGYVSSDINNLTNTDLTYIMSVNCLTGKYNNGTDVFAEIFHRHTYNDQPSGALGILAASEVSYSFVNDAFVWGMYDNMWPDFMPTYGSTPAERGILPAFGNAAGKYFLEQSSWPYNTTEKEVTYNLFHHHGDAFLTVYSEVPQNLTVVHNPTIFTGVTSFNVTANTGALICLSLNGEILGTGIGTGSPVSITIPGNQLPPDHIDVVVTLQNFYRYEGEVTVIPPAGPYVVKDNFILNDNAGNNNGLMDYGEAVQLTLGVKNVGIVQANNVNVTLSSSDTYITITTNSANYGNIPAGTVINVNNAFAFTVANNIPDNHNVNFTLTATDGTNTWMSYFSIKGHAPVISYLSYTISDPLGNNNGKIEPGETVSLNVTMKNSGSADAINVNGLLSTTDPYILVNSGTLSFGNANASGTATAVYSITADNSTPPGHLAIFDLALTANLGISGSGTFNAVIGQIPILIIDVDPNHNSGPVMMTAIQDLGLSAEYQTSVPADINLYSSIFVCLGIYSTNTALSSSQGTQLKDYLDNGGRLYMEGGDTWAYDAETPVHPYFKIDGTSDGSADLSNLVGQPGTFTADMNFSYSGGNSYIDHIEVLAGSTAFKIFQNPTGNYGTGIAYDGGSYRTIGTSHEFGGLSDGTMPSTKANLMFYYLTFFGIIPEGLNANFTAQNTNVCQGTTASFTDNSTGNPTAWEWSFPGGTPATSTLQNPVVTYAVSGNYNVTLIVHTGTETDTIVKYNFIHVILAPAQASQPTGPASLCNNTPFSNFYTTNATGATSYSWSLTPSTAGVITGTTTTGTVYWNVTYSGSVSISVTALNSCGQAPISAAFTLTLNPSPTVTLNNFGNVCTYWPAFTLAGGIPTGGTYSGLGVNNNIFNPGQANIGYNNITYTYSDANSCSATASKSIFVDACTGLDNSNPGVLSLDIYPNPVNTYLTLKINGLKSDNLKIKITNPLGEIISEQNNSVFGSKYESSINTSQWSKGLYFIIIENDEQLIIRKILVD